MGYLLLGDDGDAPAPEKPSITLETLSAKTDVMLAEIRASERARQIGSYIAIGSAVFAAFRLGILAFPQIREKYRAKQT